MPATQPSKEVRPFCYEHHVEMRLTQSLSATKDASAQTRSYACTEPDCLVQFNAVRGYFILSREGTAHDLDVVPNVRCLREATPMYLAELDPNKTSFRLWICPHCDGRRTNEESLIGLGRDEIQNGSDESRVQS